MSTVDDNAPDRAATAAADDDPGDLSLDPPDPRPGVPIARAVNAVVKAVERSVLAASEAPPPDARSFGQFIDALRPGRVHALLGPAEVVGPMALRLLIEFALERRLPTLFASTSGPEAVLAQRLLAADARVNVRDLRVGALPDGSWVAFMKATARLRNATLSLVDRGSFGRVLDGLHEGLGAVVIELPRTDFPEESSDEQQRLLDDLDAAASVFDAPVIVAIAIELGETIGDVGLADDVFDLIATVEPHGLLVKVDVDREGDSVGQFKLEHDSDRELVGMIWSDKVWAAANGPGFRLQDRRLR